MSGSFTVPAAIVPEVIARAAAAGAGHYLPLLRAMGDSRIVCVSLNRASPGLDLRQIGRVGRPAVLVLHDDGGAATGPTGFAVARKALRWARSHVIHGTGAQAWHYEAVVALAEGTGSCCPVETSAALAAAWHALAVRAAMPRKAPCLVLVPPPGGAHPLPVAPGALH